VLGADTDDGDRHESVIIKDELCPTLLIFLSGDFLFFVFGIVVVVVVEVVIEVVVGAIVFTTVSVLSSTEVINVGLVISILFWFWHLPIDVEQFIFFIRLFVMLVFLSEDSLFFAFGIVVVFVAEVVVGAAAFIALSVLPSSEAVSLVLVSSILLWLWQLSGDGEQLVFIISTFFLSSTGLRLLHT